MEYATNHPNLSIRDFLIQKRGFTARQYRYIVSLAPANDWRGRCQEIQNDIAAKKIGKYSEDASEIHGQYLAASKLVLARAMALLISDSKAGSRPAKPVDILNCANAIARAQEIFMRAMGVEKSEGLLQIYEQVSQTVQAKVEVSQQKTALQKEIESRLSYDDVMEFVHYRRELRLSRPSAPVAP